MKNGRYGGYRRCSLRWVWTTLVVVLVGGASYLGWRYASWEPTAPEPPKQTTTIKIPVSGRPEKLPGATATTEIKEGRFEITLPIPTTPPKGVKAPAEKNAAGEKEPEPAPVAAGPIQPPEATVPAQAPAKVGPGGIEERDLAQAPVQQQRPAHELTYQDLEKPLQVGDLTIPPPQAVPPFSQGEKPVFILETERQGRTISVRGTTNLPVEGNGVQVSLFRIFREGDSREVKRASLDTRNLSLWFEGRFPVDDGQWLRARQENEKDHPAIFPAMSFLDQDSVQVEVLFTGTVKDLGPMPGLTVYPIPGTDKQVYRIIRSISLPLSRQPGKTPPLEKAEQEKPALKTAEQEKAQAAKPLRRPGGPTRIRISPLKWLDGPQQVESRINPPEALPQDRPGQPFPASSLALARPSDQALALRRVLTYRF